MSAVWSLLIAARSDPKQRKGFNVRSAYDAVIEKKKREIRCSVVITEIDGKLAIMAQIPDGAENTVAGTLAKALIEQSAGIMNAILGEDQRVEKVPQPS